MPNLGGRPRPATPAPSPHWPKASNARGRTVLALALAAVSVLTSCHAAGGAAGRPLAATSVNAAGRDSVAEGGSLRWGISDFPAQWNPHHANGNLVTVETVMGGLLPSPWRSNAEAVNEPDPDFVDDVEVSVKPKQVVTLHLNRKARWSDDTPITWRDYRAMADALSGRDRAYQVTGQTGYDRIASIKPGADRFEVVITFAEPFADYTSLFHLMLPASYTEDPEKFNSGYLDKMPVTAGPFGSAKFDRTAKSVTVSRSDTWWGEPARLDSIVFRSMAPEALDAAFLDGGVDTFTMPMDAASYERVKGARDGEVRAARAPDYRHLTLNGESPLLSDVDVRHAVFLAIDRRAVAASAFSGLDLRPSIIGNHFLMPGQDGYTDNGDDWGGFDPDKARELLDGAGWKASDGDEPRRKGGKELELRFTVPQGFAPAQSEAELIQSMLAEVGIGVKIDGVPRDELFADHVVPGNFDMVAFVNSGSSSPISQYLQSWSSPVEDDKGREQWRANVGRIASPAIDGAMNDALGALDKDELADHINEADRLLWESGHTLPLYQRPELVAARDDLANVGAGGFAKPDYADIGFLR